MNYALHLRTLYRLWGVDAELTPEVGSPLTLRVIDKTAGVEVFDMNGTPSLRPAAQVRVSEIDDAAIARSELPGAILDMNGKRWRIESTGPMPTTKGEAQGQLMLYLIEAP
jgi:hypothetical protein